jgi:hypothetical protein
MQNDERRMQNEFQTSALGYSQRPGFVRRGRAGSSECLGTGVVIFSILVLLLGCDRGAEVAAPVAAVRAGTCMIRGVVRFVGTAPAPKVIGGECCPGVPPVMDESLSVNPGGTLKNVVVFIKDGPKLDLPLPQDAVLAQRGCQYVPHVLALKTGQNLVVTSHDPTLHNVHVEADLNPSENFSETQGQSHSLKFDQPELVKFKCDVHPWMTAYAYVFDHPCFAVTGNDGKFEIEHLPPGTYTLVAWQEELQKQEMQVTVSADKPAEVTVEYHGE